MRGVLIWVKETFCKAPPHLCLRVKENAHDVWCLPCQVHHPRWLLWGPTLWEYFWRFKTSGIRESFRGYFSHNVSTSIQVRITKRTLNILEAISTSAPPHKVGFFIVFLGVYSSVRFKECRVSHMPRCCVVDWDHVSFKLDAIP